MSIKLLARIWEEAELSRPHQAVLLAMADHANDDGSQCFPSVNRIAWKTGYKPRNVTDIIRELKGSGILIEVAKEYGHRPVEYQINIDKAPQKQPFDVWLTEHGRHSSRENAPVQSHETGVQSHVNSSRENAPRTVIEPSRETSLSSPKRKQKRITYPEDFERFWLAYPKGHGTKKLAYTEWKKIDPEEHQSIHDGLNRWLLSKRWSDGYIRDAERFLKHRMWENPPADMMIGRTRGPASTESDPYGNQMLEMIGNE